MNPSIGTNRVRNAVKTVNGIAPDINGEVTTIAYVETVNGTAPTAGNVDVIGTISGSSSNNTISVSAGGLPGEYDFQARVSSNAANGLSAVSDGLYMSKLASDLEVTPYGSFSSATNVQTALQNLSDSAIATAHDTNTINFSTGGGAITGDVKLSHSSGNLVSSTINGLYASNNSIDVRADGLAGFGFPSNTMDVRAALIHVGTNRIPSQPENGAGIPTNPIFADVSLKFRTGALVNETMHEFENPYGVPGYDSSLKIVANADLGSGIALSFSQDGSDTTRYTLWIDASGKVRVKSGALPTTDTAGVIVGTQS